MKLPLTKSDAAPIELTTVLLPSRCQTSSECLFYCLNPLVEVVGDPTYHNSLGVSQLKVKTSLLWGLQMKAPLRGVPYFPVILLNGLHQAVL